MQKKSKYTFKLRWDKVRLRTLLYLVLISCSTHLLGQSPYFTKPAANDFLGGVTIQNIYESKLGFLWLGTNQGVFRYDGTDFKQYTLPTDTIAQSSMVSTIYQTKDNQMLIAFDDGRLYRPSFDGQLVPWDRSRELQIAVPITGLWENQDQLWMATYGQGLIIATPDSIYRYDQEKGLLGNDLYEMVVDEEHQKIYLATDRGVNVCSMRDGIVNIETHTAESGLPGYVIQSLKIDKNKTFCVGTFENGVFSWDPETKAIMPLFQDWNYGSVTSLELFEGRELWVGTERRGLIQYQLESQTYRLINEVDGLSIGRVEDLHKDSEGNLWVVSNTLGLIKANRYFDFLEKNIEAVQNIQAIATDQNNQLWIGTQDGVFIMDKEEEEGENRYKKALEDIETNVLSLFADERGYMWIGTFGDGIYIYDPDTDQVRHLTKEDGLVDGSVLSIDGYDDKIWVGTFAGVTQFILPEDVFSEVDMSYNLYDAENQLNAAFIYKVFVDSKKRTWLGTDSEGVNAIEDEDLSYYAGADSIPFKSVYSITEDLQGDIWFTTTTEGLFRYNGEDFLRFGLENGLRNLNITSLITDDQGNILVLHTNGIDILDPLTGQVIYYDEEVGINNLEPNLNVVTKDKNGDIWIGGQTQILKYIAPTEPFRVSPRTTLDQVDVAGDVINYKQKTVFPYNENTFLFNYKGLWYTDPEAIQYRYQLEGLDRDWITTRDQEVNYVNLPPGTYTFKISSTANNSFSQEPIEAYRFTVKRPFWRQAWFIILVAVLLTWLIWILQRTREGRIIKESKLKQEKIESQLEALKSQVNPHFLFNSFNTLVAIIEESPRSAVNYVEKLSDFYRSILQYRDKKVIPLAEELTVVQNYLYLLKERFGDKLKISINTNEKERESFVPPLSIQMLVENAIKHNVVSSHRPLHIKIDQQKGGQLIIRNTLQPKRIKPKSTSFGLSSIIARFSLLSDKRVQVNKSNGEFVVVLPLIKSDFSEKTYIDPAMLEKIEDELGQ